MITDIQEAIANVAHRNALRASSGLPLLAFRQEVRKTIFYDRRLVEDDLWRQFAGKIGTRILDGELARERRKRNDPNWTPRASFLNGNPNFFYNVARRKEALFRRLCRDELTSIDQNYARLAEADTGAP